MNLKLAPTKLAGTVIAPPSKSYAHRILIAIALYGKTEYLVRLSNISEDIRATAEALRTLGCKIEYRKEGILIAPMIAEGNRKRNLQGEETECRYSGTFTRKDTELGNGGTENLYCGESGSTARFLLPVAATLKSHFIMTGDGRLPERPFSPLVREMRKMGCTISSEHLPMEVSGQLKSGIYELEGNVSSQFVTGLLFALPMMPLPSVLNIRGEIESAGYIRMTIEILSQFGVRIKKDGNRFLISGNARDDARSCLGNQKQEEVEGDWTNAAVFYTMNYLGCNIAVEGLNFESNQGDRQIGEILAVLEEKRKSSSFLRPETLTEDCATIIDASQIPDIVPAIAVAASVTPGITRIVHAGRLRLKESDRLLSTCNLLNGLGGKTQITSDGLRIEGVPHLMGGRADGAGDHRIVMAAAITSVISVEPVEIIGVEAVDKSYPGFFEVLRALGAKLY